MGIQNPALRESIKQFGFLCLFIVLSFFPEKSHASEPKLERVKTAFVYKFLQLVEWNGNEGDSHEDTLVIGILGDERVLDRLSILKGRSIGDRRIIVKLVNDKSNGAGLIHVLYVDKSRVKRLEQRLSTLENPAVLTISEGSKNELHSSMIVLYEDDGYVRFDINNTLARSKGIKLNAKLLELAGEIR